MIFLGKFRNKSSRIFEVFLINHTECIWDPVCLRGLSEYVFIGAEGFVFAQSYDCISGSMPTFGLKEWREGGRVRDASRLHFRLLAVLPSFFLSALPSDRHKLWNVLFSCSPKALSFLQRCIAAEGDDASIQSISELRQGWMSVNLERYYTEVRKSLCKSC